MLESTCCAGIEPLTRSAAVRWLRTGTLVTLSGLVLIFDLQQPYISWLTECGAAGPLDPPTQT